MNKLDELIEKYYEKFVGLPSNRPIVRQNQKNDAFEIVVLETLYGEELGIDIEKMKGTDVEKLSKYIVAPPDSGIDIVVEHDDSDGNTYDFIQVKNTSLSPLDFRKEIDYMRKTIKEYLKKPSNVSSVNLKEVLAETDFSRSDESNCRYIIVHRGESNFFKGQKEGEEQVITGNELEMILEVGKKTIPKVCQETFGSDSFNNYIEYDKSQKNPAILMNICGYDLAKLALKYTNTTFGRNLLFDQNLRGSLSKKSKTYVRMAETIVDEPEKFWFYNNGITVIAEDIDTKKNEEQKAETIILKDFSIINGAQTTTALGLFLREAQLDNDISKIDKLKKVFVLARILKVTEDKLKTNIAIYNNTQNPITTRDMASIRKEQKDLFDGLSSGEKPNIFMEYKRGINKPSGIRFYEHQCTTNVELAQLAFAGFETEPNTAKDKKNTIFDTDYKLAEEDILINKYYNRIFNPNDGVLFKKTKEDINELLFVHYLYKLSKKNLIAIYKKRIGDAMSQKDNCDDCEREGLDDRIKNYENLKAIANICAFYCISYYYKFKKEFPNEDKNLIYRYSDFYSNKEYQNKLIERFRDLFLTGTIEIIKKLAISGTTYNTWVRDKKSAEPFMKQVNDDLQLNMDLETKYKEYIKQFKQ